MVFKEMKEGKVKTEICWDEYHNCMDKCYHRVDLRFSGYEKSMIIINEKADKIYREYEEGEIDVEDFLELED